LLHFFYEVVSLKYILLLFLSNRINLVRIFRSPADGEVENMSASRDSLQTTRSVEFDNPSTRSVEFDNQTTRSVEFDNQTTRSGDSLDFNDRNGRPTRYSGKELRNTLLLKGQSQEIGAVLLYQPPRQIFFGQDNRKIQQLANKFGRTHYPFIETVLQRLLP
jgi:hypothetical protein